MRFSGRSKIFSIFFKKMLDTSHDVVLSFHQIKRSRNQRKRGKKMGLNECYELVVFEVEELGRNIFEELGKAIIRNEQDVFFNNTMIDAYKKYINDHNIKWND